MRDEVFRKILDARLRIYAVWQPILPTDGPEKLAEATTLLAGDPRVSQYWDPGAKIGRRFAEALQLPLTTPAWDVYLLYPPQSRWNSSIPLPTFWMHQLRFLPFSEAAKKLRKQQLDGVRFRGEIEKLLGSPSKPARGLSGRLGLLQRDAVLQPMQCDRVRVSAARQLRIAGRLPYGRVL